RDLGYGNLGLGYAGLQNQANIANQQNQLGYAGLNNQANIAGMQNQTTRDLGYGNLNLGYQNSAQNYNLGVGGLQNQRYATDVGAATTMRGQDQN
ncbi:hypothetical protein, partial [Levilactobacillus tujiorum]|uniref:hypothetical protein n=1 Tax=Levilactobacillus tujiorum TaxID=2912243 RepID=UPI001F0DF6E2